MPVQRGTHVGAVLGCAIVLLALSASAGCRSKPKPPVARAAAAAPAQPSPPTHVAPPKPAPPEVPSTASDDHVADDTDLATACSPMDPHYNQCLIAHLEGHVHTERELALLIASYRMASNMPKALQHMREYVQRYPTQQRSYMYRQLLARHQGQIPPPSPTAHADTAAHPAPSPGSEGAAANAPHANAAANAPPPGTSAHSPLSGVRDCDPQGAHFSQCVIAHLEGHTHNALELELLIASYKAMGNMPKALQHMREYVQRYPTQQHAYLYREILSRHIDRRPRPTPSAHAGARAHAAESAALACNPEDAHYSQCVIAHLEGHADNARDLALLIASYRQIGNQPKALQHMAEYVQRYPTDQKAYQYRMLLARHQH